MLPTADAFEDPAALITAGMSWAERLDVDIAALMVLHRHEAEDPGAAGVIDGANAVYLVGDSSLHLRSTLKDTEYSTAKNRSARAPASFALPGHSRCRRAAIDSFIPALMTNRGSTSTK